MPSAKPTTERAFLKEFQRLANSSGAVTLRVASERWEPVVHVISFDGLVDYEERAPAYHEATWAYWWALRILHPRRLADFDARMREIHATYAKGDQGTWASFNHEKREALAKLVILPYAPKKRRTRK